MAKRWLFDACVLLLQPLARCDQLQVPLLALPGRDAGGDVSGHISPEPLGEQREHVYVARPRDLRSFQTVRLASIVLHGFNKLPILE